MEMPFGATTLAEGGVRFRLFAPAAERVMLELEGQTQRPALATMGDGWHELTSVEAREGSRYRYVLPDGTAVPDPASRYQPRDLAGPSEVIDPSSYAWHDSGWPGRPWHEAVLYELHVGTFTAEGTFGAAREKMPHLARLGITAIELMCLADFAGNRNWGYDGVLLFAPDSAYGTPNDLKAFIDAAHAHGIMIVLDVVYSHFGPEGNDIPRYFPQVASDRHDTPWGKALNFDGEHSGVVRDFILSNALYWIDEFHMDGLRFDASHAMIDESPRHILDDVRDCVTALGCGRPIHLILEHETGIEARLRRDSAGRPTSYTAQWNHDITHLLGAAFTELSSQSEDETRKLTKALAEGFVIAEQEQHAGTVCCVPPTAFVAFMQTHDLVGNRVFGERIFADAPAAKIRAVAAVYLLLPQIPMIFMGEEWGASTPFPYFCDYHGALAEAVQRGRREDLSHLNPAPSADELNRAPDPQADSTLRSAQLRWGEIAEQPHAAWLFYYTSLLAIRRQQVVPLLSRLTRCCGTAEVLAPGVFRVAWNLDGARLHLAASLCSEPTEGLGAIAGEVIWGEGSDASDEQPAPWTVRLSVERAGTGAAGS